MLECVDNPEKHRSYSIEFETAEFTALYAKTGQPIFASLEISYTPADRCLEQYLKSFRDTKVFYEGVINQIVDGLVEACDPVYLKVAAQFTVRGGISTRVTVTYGEAN